MLIIYSDGVVGESGGESLLLFLRGSLLLPLRLTGTFALFLHCCLGVTWEESLVASSGVLSVALFVISGRESAELGDKSGGGFLDGIK